MIERMVAKRWLSVGKNYWYIDWSDDSGFGFGSNLVDVNKKDFLFENTNSLFSDFFLIGFLVVLLQRMVSHFIVLISQVFK